jgi:hypothetical protein
LFDNFSYRTSSLTNETNFIVFPPDYLFIHSTYTYCTQDAVLLEKSAEYCFSGLEFRDKPARSAGTTYNSAGVNSTAATAAIGSLSAGEGTTVTLAGASA